MLNASDVVVTASGTATVQTALHLRPMVIVYRLSPLTYRLGRRFVKLDTFGMVNLEAMEHGKPVVATLFGGSPEVVADGVTGFVANPFDTATFAERIARLLRDPALAARMGAAGRERALERFRIERLTREFLEEYATALELVGRAPDLAQGPATGR